MTLKSDPIRCAYCLKLTPRRLVHWDHVDPSSRGGAASPENLVLACGDCNMSKGAKPLLQFMAQVGARHAAQKVAPREPSTTAYRPMTRMQARASLLEIRELLLEHHHSLQRISAMTALLWEALQTDAAPPLLSGDELRAFKPDMKRKSEVEADRLVGRTS